MFCQPSYSASCHILSMLLLPSMQAQAAVLSTQHVKAPKGRTKHALIDFVLHTCTTIDPTTTPPNNGENTPSPRKEALRARSLARVYARSSSTTSSIIGKANEDGTCTRGSGSPPHEHRPPHASLAVDLLAGKKAVRRCHGSSDSNAHQGVVGPKIGEDAECGDCCCCCSRCVQVATDEQASHALPPLLLRTSKSIANSGGGIGDAISLPLAL